MDLIGRKIAGKFVVEKEIGKGGMGTVYLARQEELEKHVAIKVLREELAREEEYVKRFKREAKAASKIDHPNIMRVLDFGFDGDVLYMAMELLDGKSLHDIIKDEAPLDPDRIAELTRQTLAGLAAAHDLGILHRDLKPENIIVVKKRTDEGVDKEIVKVCDFGIAKVGSDPGSTGRLTIAGSIVGTPEYMSPEQARGEGTIDARSDLYSVGAMMYEMLTKRPPFVANTALGVVLMHLNDKVVPPSELVKGLDLRLETVCLSALAKDPKDRHASAREMRAALSFKMEPIGPISAPKLVLTGSDPPPPPTSATQMAISAPPPRRSMPSAKEILEQPIPQKKFPIVPVVFGVALLAGGIFFLVNRPSSPPTTTNAPVVTTSAPRQTISHTSAPLPTPSPTPTPVAIASTIVDASVAPSSSKPPVAPPVVTQSTSAPPPPPEPTPLGPLHVTLGNVTADKVSTAVIAAAVPFNRIERCYRDGAMNKSGTAKLHVVLTPSSTESTFAAPPELGTIAECVVRAANKINVELPNGPATADIDLVFKSD